jgi:hypothetical protein
VQAFVVLLWRELNKGSDLQTGQACRWVRALELAAKGHEQALEELATLQAQIAKDTSLF